MQKAGTSSDDLLDTLNEYSPLMKAAGVSGEQFVGILDQGLAVGVRNTDLLGDAIKETNIRLQAGDTSKAIGDISSPITKEIQAIV